MIIFHINDLQVVSPRVRHAWHVGFFLNNRLLDAHPRYGVTFRPQDDIIKHYHKIHLTHSDEARVEKWLGTQIGLPFGEWQNIDLKNRQAWTCLELVSAAFENALNWKIYRDHPWSLEEVRENLVWDCS